MHRILHTNINNILNINNIHKLSCHFYNNYSQCHEILINYKQWQYYYIFMFIYMYVYM